MATFLKAVLLEITIVMFRVRLNEYIDKIETAFRDGNTEEARYFRIYNLDFLDNIAGEVSSKAL